MKYVLISLMFCSVFVACTLENPKTPNTNVLQSYPVETEVIPLDSMEKPKVILVDENKLKKVPVGKPRVVPANTNVHPVGQPKVVKAGKPRILTPGKDGFPLPKKVLAKGRKVKAEMPEMVVAKDAVVGEQNSYSFSTFTALQGLKNDYINCTLQDHLGNLWVGGLSGGLSKYDGKYFTNYNLHGEKSFSNSNIIFRIYEDHSGNIWIGTSSNMIKYDGKYFTYFKNTDVTIISGIIEDHFDNLWFTEGGKLVKYDGKYFSYFTIKKELGNYLSVH